MPRPSNETKALAEKHSASMNKCESFEVWAKRHLGKTARVEEFRKAFTYLKGKDDDQEIAGL